MSETDNVRELWIRRATELLEKGREIPDGEGGATYTQPSAKDMEVILKGLVALGDNKGSNPNRILEMVNRLGTDERYRNLRYQSGEVPPAVGEDEEAA